MKFLLYLWKVQILLNSVIRSWKSLWTQPYILMDLSPPWQTFSGFTWGHLADIFDRLNELNVCLPGKNWDFFIMLQLQKL